MTRFESPLSGGLVQAGQKAFRLKARLSAPVEGWTVTWAHEDVTVTTGVGASGHDVWCELAEVETSHAGTWVVVARKEGETVTSAKQLVVLETGTRVERPLLWQGSFANCVWIFLGLVFALFVAITGVRVVQLVWRNADAGKTDAALLVLCLVLIGVGLLLVVVFMALVDLRGRAREVTADSSSVLEVSGEDVASVIDALGRLRGINLVAVSGLLCLAGAAVVSWHLA